MPFKPFMCNFIYLGQLLNRAKYCSPDVSQLTGIHCIIKHLCSLTLHNTSLCDINYLNTVHSIPSVKTHEYKSHNS